MLKWGSRQPWSIAYWNCFLSDRASDSLLYIIALVPSLKEYAQLRSSLKSCLFQQMIPTL
jgi:hypothetical protein